METANVAASVTMDTSGFDRAMERVKSGLATIKAGIQSVEKAGLKLRMDSIVNGLKAAQTGSQGLEKSMSRVNTLFGIAAKSARRLAAFDRINTLAAGGRTKASPRLAAFDQINTLPSSKDRGGSDDRDDVELPKVQLPPVDTSGLQSVFAVLGALSAALQVLGTLLSTVGGTIVVLVASIGVAFAAWNITALQTGILGLVAALVSLGLALQIIAANGLPSGFSGIQDLAGGVQGLGQGVWDAIASFVAFGANLATIAGLFTQGTTVTAVYTAATAVKTTTTTVGTVATTTSTVATTTSTVATTAGTAATTAATVATWLFNAAMAVLTSPITLVVLAIGALIAIVLLLIKFWPEISAAASAAWEWIKNVWNTVANWFNVNVIQPIAGFFTNIWTQITTGAGAALQWLQNAWRTVATWFDTNVIQPIARFFTGLWNNIRQVFTTVGTTIGNAIGGAFRTVVNAIIRFAEGTINGFIRAINAAIGLINLIPGVNIGLLAPLSIPRLARGGVISRPTVALIGEAGREAVMPLENNTGWMAEMARQLAAAMSGPQLAGGGDILIPVYLDGNLLDQVIVSAQERKDMRSNGR